MSRRRAGAARLLAVLTLIALSLAIGGCSPSPAQRTVTIGYMGGLTGRAASLGLEGRDGAQLAVELANASSSGGARYVLEAADDASDSATAVNQLADTDAVAIVGPMTSSSAVLAVPVANELGITLLSPAVSTDSLSALDDEFLRIYPANQSAAEELSQQVVDMFDAPEVAAIYDFGNRAHTETWLAHFKQNLTERGGAVSAETTFTSGRNPNYSAIAAATVDAKSDCVFILANAIDTAMLCQRIRATGSTVHIIATEWSSTDDLIQNGGRTVDDMLFIQTYDRMSTNPDYVTFVKAFQNRYSYTPGFAGLHAYDATRMIIDAVAQGATRETIRRTLLESGGFEGSQAQITLDQYGDVKPKYYVMTIEDGVFVRADHR